MTPNVPASLVNMLLTIFFIVLILGAAIGSYAAVSLKKLERKVQQKQ